MNHAGRDLIGKPLPKDLDWKRTALVLVEGVFPNTCGHILIYVSGMNGHYFHFIGVNADGTDGGMIPAGYPRYLSETDYKLYLQHFKKSEITRRFVNVPHPEAATKKLSELIQNVWGTMLISHNCASFAAQVLHAGGNFYDLPEHCPALEMGSLLFWEFLRRKLGTQGSYEAKRMR